MSNLNSIIENDIRVVTILDAQVLDEEYAHEVASELTTMVNTMNETALIIDMERVSFLASVMIGKFIQLRNYCRNKSVGFSLFQLDENVSEAIALMRMNELLNVHLCKASAIAAVTGASQE